MLIFLREEERVSKQHCLFWFAARIKVSFPFPPHYTGNVTISAKLCFRKVEEVSLDPNHFRFIKKLMNSQELLEIMHFLYMTILSILGKDPVSLVACHCVACASIAIAQAVIFLKKIFH